MNIGQTAFLLFSKVHNKPDTGSSRIRGQWLMKYWPEAEEFQYGKHYNNIIFQKVYEPEYAQMFDGVKILDCCDPDYLDCKIPFMQMVEACDAVTVPTEMLQKTIQGWTNKPVVVIPDRHDLDHNKEKKIHKGRAKEVCWFGYAHNAGCLKSVRDYLHKYNLRISIIADQPVILSDKFTQIEERFTKYNTETINQEIIKSDIVIMPGSRDPNSRFKSNNKTVHAWMIKMPVATCVEELERFLDPKERQEEAEEKYQLAINEYNVKQSVQEMKNLIIKIRKEKYGS
jgi:hypothetical protein